MWFAVAFALLTQHAVRVVRIERLINRAQPCTQSGWEIRLHDAATRLGTTKRVRLVMSDETRTPFTSGVIDPVIVLPRAAEQWDEALRRSVLLHEFAHVLRFDALTQLIVGVSRSLVWFNPLMWVAAQRMRAERERACDDRVLNAGVLPSTYAGHLLSVAATLSTEPDATPSLAMARTSQVELRLRAILLSRTPRTVPSGISYATMSLCAALVVAPIVSMKVGAPPPKDALGESIARAYVNTVPGTNVRSSPGLPRRVAHPAVLPAVTAVAKVAIDTAVCREPYQVRPHQSGYSPFADQLYTLARYGVGDGVPHLSADVNGIRSGGWRGSNCSGKFTFAGAIRFNSDFTDIASVAFDRSRRLPENGFAEIRSTVNGIEQMLVVYPDSRVFSVDGLTQPYDDNARIWLRNALIEVDRNTASGVDKRLAALLALGGAVAVLDEVDQMPRPYSRTVYYLMLISRAQLSADEIRRVLRTTVQTIPTDYSIRRILDAVIDRFSPLSPEIRDAIRDAAMSIQTSADRDRVLGRLTF
jgi:hypothetical protein